jgi:hypothetical protein
VVERKGNINIENLGTGKIEFIYGVKREGVGLSGASS